MEITAVAKLVLFGEESRSFCILCGVTIDTGDLVCALHEGQVKVDFVCFLVTSWVNRQDIFSQVASGEIIFPDSYQTKGDAFPPPLQNEPTKRHAVNRRGSISTNESKESKLHRTQSGPSQCPTKATDQPSVHAQTGCQDESTRSSPSCNQKITRQDQHASFTRGSRSRPASPTPAQDSGCPKAMSRLRRASEAAALISEASEAAALLGRPDPAASPPTPKRCDSCGAAAGDAGDRKSVV